MRIWMRRLAVVLPRVQIRAKLKRLHTQPRTKHCYALAEAMKLAAPKQLKVDSRPKWSI